MSYWASLESIKSALGNEDARIEAIFNQLAHSPLQRRKTCLLYDEIGIMVKV